VHSIELLGFQAGQVSHASGYHLEASGFKTA
jgi:hypothetical protein